MHRFTLRIAFAILSLAIPSFARGIDALSLVPADAATVGMVRVTDMRNSPLTGRLFFETDKVAVDGDAKRFLDDAGLQPTRDVDVVVIAVTPGPIGTHEGSTLVACEGRFDPARLGKALTNRGAKPATAGGATYYLLPDSNGKPGAVAFLSTRLAVIGNVDSVVAAIATAAKGGSDFASASGLGREMGRVDPSATAWLLVDVARAQRLTERPALPKNGKGDAIASALKSVAVLALWTTDAGNELRFGGSAVSYDEETRGLLEDSVRGMLATWRLAAQDKHPELVPVIREFKVSRSSDAVSLSGTIPAQMIRAFAANHHGTAK